MMGQQSREESLFYSFRLEDQIPETHLLRLIDRHVDFSFVRERLQSFYSQTGRPSIDPEVLLRLLLVGYLYGITSERRLLEEVRMHLAYRWFTRLSLDQEVPDHSTFSKNRHGRFRQASVFREIFEEIVRRCMSAGLVEGRHLTVDGTVVQANASPHRRISREQLVEVAQVSRTVREYLADLEQQNPVADTPPEPPPASGTMSATDPDPTWAVKWGRAGFAYFDNYLIDNARSSWAWRPRRRAFGTKPWRRAGCWSRSSRWACTRRAWELTKPTAAASSWRGSSRVAFSLTSQSLIAATRLAAGSRASNFGMRRKRTPTTAPRANRCAIGAHTRPRTAPSIAPRWANAAGVPRRSDARPVPFGNSSCTRRSRRAKRSAPSPARRPTRARGETAIRSRPCLPN